MIGDFVHSIWGYRKSFIPAKDSNNNLFAHNVQQIDEEEERKIDIESENIFKSYYCERWMKMVPCVKDVNVDDLTQLRRLLRQFPSDIWWDCWNES